MLTVIRDEQDRLMGCLEWLQVDVSGQLNPKGAFIKVEQLELNPGVNGRRIVKRFIAIIAPLVPGVVGAYWERRDRFRNGIRGYRRDQLVKQPGEEVRV